MWSTILPMAALVAVGVSMPCEEARMKCAYREGCGKALQHYLIGCSGVLPGPEGLAYCPGICAFSLVALISTEEGKALMDCECGGDAYCEEEKQRTEICKPQVLRTINEPIVPCTVAESICHADSECSTAFGYYQRYCKAMFHGKKCTPKCHNSINILRRQNKAQKLKECKCDGTEDYNCRGIQRNMEKLCFHNHHHYNVTKSKAEDTPEVIMSSFGVRVTVSSIMFLVTYLGLLIR
ncbi:growth arrest-specific protein 1-like isoform X2 [Anthonomus grandis grandis]|nr:growth arrest-specific protein 1-like isoform X2 [Anthonomus grandis grandis]